MIKFTIILRRNAGMTRAEFIGYHTSEHAALFMSLPESKKLVRRYVQVHATEGEVPGLPDSRIDGTTELWFDSVDDLIALFTSEGYMAKIRPDEAKFLDLHACEFLMGTENVVYG